MSVRPSELYTDPALATGDLATLAASRVHEAQQGAKSTFVPIFVTNECDAACRMCGMRAANDALVRRTATRNDVLEQLRILKEEEGVRRVGFLTGEYAQAYTRILNLFFVGWCIRTAFDMGFEEVYFNVGHFSIEEANVLAEWVQPDEAAVMCVFQETYDRDWYRRFMSSTGALASPKADYDLRRASFENWLSTGRRHVNLGVLVGVNPQVEQELDALAEHARELSEQGAAVRLSVPRLRPALATSAAESKVTDETYQRAVAALAAALPSMPIVITTREDRDMQKTLLPMIGVLSPGSPDVAPYRSREAPANDESSSQFVIPDVRRPSVVLADAADGLGVRFEGWTAPDEPAPATRG